MVIDLAGLLRSLVDGEVTFVVIGAIAVGRLITVLEELDAHPMLDPERGIDAEVKAALMSGRNLTVTTTRGDLDVVQRLPGVPPFPALSAESVEVERFDVHFRVCSRAHLVAMKRARGAAIDLADLERLQPG